MVESKNPETLCLHAGFRSDPATGAVIPPIYATSAYLFDDADHAASLFALKEFGNIYTRIMNPTNDALEKRMAALEGGVGALTLASGQAAAAVAIQNIARAGDNIVSSPNLYGGIYNLFKNILRDQGIETRFVDPSDPKAFRRATDDKTRAYFAETLPNPRLNVFPIEEVAKIGREYGIPLIMDNTSAPILCRPFDYGAAIVMYSTTKWISGHGTNIGGMLIDGGNFDWTEFPDRQPALNTPDPSYHGAIWTEAVKEIGPVAYIIKARTTLLRDLGSCMSPFNAFLTIQGLETLPLRMRVHCENADHVAAFLKDHKKVKRLVHPSQFTGEEKARADKYLKNGYGSLIGFEIEGGVEAGKKFINSLELLYHVANIGDARSLAIHPASTTHSQLSEEELESVGISSGYIRLSIGIEHKDDIISDIKQALEKAF